MSRPTTNRVQVAQERAPAHGGDAGALAFEPILHAAETALGGINSMILALGEDEVRHGGHGCVHVLVPGEHAADYAGSPLVLHTFRRPRRGVLPTLAFAGRLLALVWRLKPGVVVLHSSIAGAAGRLALLPLRPFRRPAVIYCAHGWAFAMDVPAPAKRLYAAAERALARLTSAVVNVSAAEHDAALRAGLPAHLLHCIPNGTPAPSAAPGPSPFGTGPEVLRLLFVGRLDRQKGFDILLGAMNALRDRPVHLTVVGSAVVDGLEAESLPNVSYRGWVARKDLAPFYAHADGLVMPSRWEGLPLVAAEALSYGTPVLGSRVGGLASLIEDGVSGLVFEPDSVEALASVLRRVTAEGLRGMRPAARERWASVARLEDMAERYRALMDATRPTWRGGLRTATSRPPAARAGDPVAAPTAPP